MGDPGQVDRNADEAAERDRAGQATEKAVRGLGAIVEGHGDAMGAIVEAVGLLQRQIDAIDARVDANMRRIEAAMNRPAMERLEFIQKACLQAGHDLELALQQAMGEALRDPESAELAGGFPTIDPSIATKGDVEELNAWGVAAAQRLRDAGVVATSAPIVKRLAEIIYGLRDLGKEERLVKRMGGDQITSRTWAQAAPAQSAGEPSAIGAAWATLAPVTLAAIGAEAVENEVQAATRQQSFMGGAVVRGPDRAVVVSEGVLGQILSHVATGNPDAALALTTPVAMAPRAEYHEIKANDFGPDGFPIKPAGSEAATKPPCPRCGSSRRVERGLVFGRGDWYCPCVPTYDNRYFSVAKPAGHDDLKAAGGST